MFTYMLTNDNKGKNVDKCWQTDSKVDMSTNDSQSKNVDKWKSR